MSKDWCNILIMSWFLCFLFFCNLITFCWLILKSPRKNGFPENYFIWPRRLSYCSKNYWQTNLTAYTEHKCLVFFWIGKQQHIHFLTVSFLFRNWVNFLCKERIPFLFILIFYKNWIISVNFLGYQWINFTQPGFTKRNNRKEMRFYLLGKIAVLS